MNSAYSYFAVALDLISTDKVRALFKRLGYQSQVSAASCMEILDQEGARFGVPFAQMAKEAARTPVAKAKFLTAAQMSKASGSSAGSGMSAAQKSEMGMQWFDKISTLLLGGMQSVDDIVNATNGTDGTLAQAALLQQQLQYQEQQQKKTLYWILGGLGVIIIVIVFVTALSKRS